MKNRFKTQPQLEEEVQALLAEVEKREGLARVRTGIDPWAASENEPGKSETVTCTTHNIDPSFLEHCLSIAKGVAKPEIQSIDSERTRLTDNYPDAFTDTYGTVSGLPFVYKTGAAWPKREGGPHAHPYIRELRPLHGHRIIPSWNAIVKNVEAYLKERKQGFTAIMGFGWGNAGDKDPFCPLLMTIGVEPKTTVIFEKAKTAADYVKNTILGRAGFPDVDVAVWEWTTSFSSIGPKLPSLHPLVDGAITEFAHPFASPLGLAIAPLKKPYYEGTVALYLRRGNGSDDVLALTAAHVARPPPMYPGNTGLSEKASSRHREEIVALGDKAFENSITVIETRIGTLQKILGWEKNKIERLQQQQADGVGEADRVARALWVAEQAVESAIDDIQQLGRLHTRVTKFMATPNKRCIGHVLHADPIGVSSNEPDGFTVDWAAIQLSKDAFDWDDFSGNKIYIGGRIDQPAYQDLMYPYVADQADYEHPEDGMLQIYGVVPMSEIYQPMQRNVNGDPAMPVIKNGMTTGTTVGWVNGLKSLVRHYDHYDIDFTSLETTILPYGGRGAFSDIGDSGSIIVDRRGRIVALLTGSGGLTNETDVTFATAYCELEKRIMEALPGIHLY